jgi:2-polyprenyl-3-methyl-5-hydroxy-6-metoxy-1,4-benzoquinol methylase
VFASVYGDPADIYVNGYLTGDTDLGIDITHPLFQEYLAHVAHRRFTLVEKVVAPPGRLLDVGCGSGEMLAVARERGWEVQGVEPVEQSATYAVKERGLDVRAVLLQESGLPERSYDVVSAFHVLEHMPDGLGFLRTMTRWVRPGGCVVVETPNWRSVARRTSGAAWPYLRPLEHVAHYTPTTLASTLRRAGLTPVHIHTPGFVWRKQTLDQMLVDLGALRFKPLMLKAGVLTRERGQVAVPNELGWWVLNVLQTAYGLARVGLVVLGIARVAS